MASGKGEKGMKPFIGQIQLFPSSFELTNWAVCDGRLLPINDYTPLFLLLGNRFGGDGENTFALPDLAGKEPDPYIRYYIALDGEDPA
jgi:microcystin-dependent protein